MPGKKLTPTVDQRRQVKSMAAVGIEPRDIALYHRVSLETLRKHYKEELFQGPLEANAQHYLRCPVMARLQSRAFTGRRLVAVGVRTAAEMTCQSRFPISWLPQKKRPLEGRLDDTSKDRFGWSVQGPCYPNGGSDLVLRTARSARERKQSFGLRTTAQSSNLL